MNWNKYILFTVSASLAAGVALLSRTSGVGQKPQVTLSAFDSEEEHENDFRVIDAYNSLRLNEVTGTVEPQWVKAAYDQANAMRVSSRAAKPIKWTNLGPDNVGGRTRAFLMHRDSVNLMFVGSVSGGLFRSNTAGQSWYPVNDMQENLNVNCIAQTPDGTIYYGTGEGSYTNLGGNKGGSPAFLGMGVFKSTDDRGLTFNNLVNTKSWTACNQMVAHPTENWLWVATSAGVYKTTDGGASWKLVRGGNITDMTIDVNGIVWCSSNNGVVYKGDADGTTFNSMNNGITIGGRTGIAVSPQDPQYVYLLGSSSGSVLAGVWRSTNGGANWDLIVARSPTVTDILAPQGNPQGYYNNSIVVDPLNKNKIYLGGVYLASWDNVKGYREISSSNDAIWNSAYVHADIHILTYDTRTSPPTLIAGTDGGLFFTQNQTTWTRRSRGFTSLQLYHVAANYLGDVAGGAQDNGTNLINGKGNSTDGSAPKTGLEIYNNDGMETEFSRINPSIIFMSDQVGNVGRTSNSGQSSSSFWDDRFDGKSVAGFLREFSLWEKDDKTSMLFFPNAGALWVALNPTVFSEPVSWFLISNSMGSAAALEVDHSPDGDHVFCAKPGKVYRVDGIQGATYDLGTTPNTVPANIKTIDISGSVFNGRIVTSVNVDQSDANHVVITLGGYGNNNYVYETTEALDSNPTWKNITGNLPKMPCYDAVVDVDNPKRILIGTELGMWLTENGGSTWEEANDGMARVPVYEIRGYEFNPWEGMTIYIGTHGRGYYKSTSLTTSTKKINANKAQTATAYPNPASTVVNLSYKVAAAGTTQIEIFNIKGEKIQVFENRSSVGQNQFALNTTSFATGYYFARITQGKEAATVKFAIDK